MIRPRLIFIFLIFNMFCASAQNPLLPFASVRADYGKVAATNDFVQGKNAAHRNIEQFKGFAALLGVQTNGNKDWHHIHNFPQMGVGVQFTRVDYDDELGKPFSVFGFYNGTFARKGRHTLRYTFDGGLAGNWNYYNHDENKYNTAIGSPVTVHLSFGLEYAYRLGNHFEVGVSGAFTHFSNGAIRKPNKGLNLLSPRVRLSYLLREPKLPERKFDIEKPTGNEIFVAFGYGPKRYECEYAFFDPLTPPEIYDIYPLNSKYLSLTLSAGFLHRYGHKGKYGGGVNLLYDDWMGAKPHSRAKDADIEWGTMSQRFAVGIFAAHELCISQVSVLTHLGVNVYEPKDLPDRKSRDFERFGVKYNFGFNVSAGVFIYAHRFSKADFVEWSLGYSFKLKTKG